MTVQCLIESEMLEALADGSSVQLYPKDNNIFIALSPGARSWLKERQLPVAMLLNCPICHMRHVDKGDFVTKVHHTHACQFCGHVWRPAIVPTVGVQFLPGFKDGDKP